MHSIENGLLAKFGIGLQNVCVVPVHSASALGSGQGSLRPFGSFELVSFYFTTVSHEARECEIRATCATPPCSLDSYRSPARFRGLALVPSS